MENQESMWYAPSDDTPQAPPPVLVPPAKPKKKMPAWGIALILVAVAVLIIGSCLLFRNSAAADPNHPGAAGDLPNDYKSFFDNYFTERGSGRMHHSDRADDRARDREALPRR